MRKLNFVFPFSQTSLIGKSPLTHTGRKNIGPLFDEGLSNHLIFNFPMFQCNIMLHTVTRENANNSDIDF